MVLPPSRRGIYKIAQGKTLIITQPFPRLRRNCIIIKTVAVALNPTDWQTVENEFSPWTPPVLLGCDVSGIVVAVGSSVIKPWKKGDRVAGFGHGGNEVGPEDGTFADYVLLNGDLAIRIPDYLTFEDAATLGCDIVTTALSLYSPKFLNLPFPTSDRIGTKEGKSIFIYDGITAMGTMAIQFAKISGLTIFTTSSFENVKLLESYGADHTFSPNNPNCGPVIRAYTRNKLRIVLDTVATSFSARLCADALSPTSETPLLYVNLKGIANPRSDVASRFPLGFTIEGQSFVFKGEKWPAMPEDYELGRKFVLLTEELLESRAIKPYPVDLRGGGIDGILSGMQDLKDGKVGDVKLVYRISE